LPIVGDPNISGRSDGHVELDIKRTIAPKSIQILHWRVLFATDDRNLGQD